MKEVKGGACTKIEVEHLKDKASIILKNIKDSEFEKSKNSYVRVDKRTVIVCSNQRKKEILG